MLRHFAPLALLLLAGCRPKGPAGPNEYVIDCEAADAGQPVTSDENYAGFVNAAAAGNVQQDACRSPELLSPAPGSTLDPRTPPAFSFNATHASCARSRALPRGALGCRLAPAHPPAASRLLDLVGAALEGTAEAHCGAITGENYLLSLTAGSDSQPLYSALLSVTSYTPDASAWKQALSGRSGQTVRLTIQRAVFLRGDINEGPYTQPQPYTFTVGQ